MRSEMIVVGWGNNDTMGLQVAEGPCIRILAAAEGWHWWMEIERSGKESMLMWLAEGEDVDPHPGVIRCRLC